MKHWMVSCTAGLLFAGSLTGVQADDFEPFGGANSSAAVATGFEQPYIAEGEPAYADEYGYEQDAYANEQTEYSSEFASEYASEFASEYADELPEPNVCPIGFESEGDPLCGDGCGDECVDGLCDNCCNPCCAPFGKHRSGLFGDYLFLSARNADLPIAVPQDGILATSVPIGRRVTADNDYESGFRVGGRIADECGRSSVEATFWNFNSSSQVTDSLAGGAGFLRALTVHPNTVNVAADSLTAAAEYDIDFQIVDLVYRGSLLDIDCCTNSALNYVVGVRYAHMNQDLLATYSINGVTTVSTEVDLDAVGPRFGLEGERKWSYGMLFYARCYANFLVGEFNADYAQNNVFAGQQARLGFDDDRIIPVYEIELGAGWQSDGGRIRITAGYYLAWWTNTLTVPATINSVQTNNTLDVSETLGFDGLTTRAEIRF